MSQQVEAVYENGVLRPLTSLSLPEHQHVTVTISESAVPGEEGLDLDCWQDCAAEADENICLETVRRALAKIPGSLTPDFSAEREER